MLVNNGSAFLRVHGLVKYWKEAEVFKYGQKYDVVIFQKAYLHDYAEGLECFKILDLCDPDWLGSWIDIVRMINAVDCVTCSSPLLTEYIKKITDKPVYFVADRHDMEFLKQRKTHKGKAKQIAWFGYGHNAHVLKQVVKYVDDKGIKLNAICDSEDKLGMVLTEREKSKVNFVKFNQERINDQLIKNDFIVLPNSLKPRDKYKSDNKTTWARSLNLPVAHYSDQLVYFIDEKNRIAESEKWYNKTRKEFDIKESAKEYKAIIKELSGLV